MPRMLGLRPRWMHAVVLAAAGSLLIAQSAVAAQPGAAVYDHSTPAPEAVLQTSPARIDIWTKFPTVTDTSLTQMIVTDPNARHVEADAATVDPTNHQHFWVDVQPNLPPGRYLVWFKTEGVQNFDRDGGEYAFYVGVQPTAADLKADKLLPLTTVDGGLEAISGLERGLIEGGVPLFIAAGGFYIYWVQKKRERAANGESNLTDRIDTPRR